MNNKGVVLIVMMWVLVILALIAWGLGRRSSLEVSLLETYRGKSRAYEAARDGINSILDLLQKSPSPKDTLYATGISVEQVKSLKGVMVQLRDEGGRINVNALGAAHYQVLSALFELKGLSRSEADKLALSIVGPGPALKPRKGPYENVLELLEAEGMTQELFDKIKDDVTVYGDIQRGLRVNVDTANNDVIQAVAQAAARLDPFINASDVIAQAYAVRDGADGRSFTPDDGAGSVRDINRPNWPAALREDRSNYYRARVVGLDDRSGARTVLEAVIHSTPGSPGEILSWQRD